MPMAMQQMAVAVCVWVGVGVGGELLKGGDVRVLLPFTDH